MKKTLAISLISLTSAMEQRWVGDTRFYGSTPMQRTRKDAEADCNKVNYGTLASPQTEEEYKVVIEVAFFESLTELKPSWVGTWHDQTEGGVIKHTGTQDTDWTFSPENLNHEHYYICEERTIEVADDSDSNSTFQSVNQSFCYSQGGSRMENAYGPPPPPRRSNARVPRG